MNLSDQILEIEGWEPQDEDCAQFVAHEFFSLVEGPLLFDLFVVINVSPKPPMQMIEDLLAQPAPV